MEIGEVRAELSQEVKRESTGLKTNVKVAIHIEGNITQEQKDELLKQANACYIHRQIMGEWNMRTRHRTATIKTAGNSGFASGGVSYFV